MKQKKCKVTLNSRHDKMSGTTSHLCYYKTEKKKKKKYCFHSLENKWQTMCKIYTLTTTNHFNRYRKQINGDGHCLWNSKFKIKIC